MAKPKDAVIEICTKSTLLGNKISVRMLEYLSTAKDRPLGFDALAHDFLDLCRILWAVEAGLNGFAQTNRKFPSDMISELERKFRAALTDFQNLEKMIAKLLELENRGTVGKIQKGWRKMFPGVAFDKMRDSLNRTREALRMSALVFEWSLGDAKIDESVGMGYTGLAAALERMDKSKTHGSMRNGIHGSPQTPSVISKPPERPMANLHISEAEEQARTVLPVLPPVPPLFPPEKESPRASPVVSMARPDTRPFAELSRHASMSTHSISSHGVPVPRERITSSVLEGLAGQIPRIHSGTSSHPTEDTLVEVLGEIDPLDTGTIKPVRLKADAFTVPRWTPRNTAGAHAANLKTALVTAVRSGNHALIEQLLDRGVSPDPGADCHLLNEAVLQQDLESMRLLLLFGADPNINYKDGLPPLSSAVEESFVDGATMLLKYGADPNRASGPDARSPLVASAALSNGALLQLLLTYGGDANQLLPNGETLLTQSIGKSSQKKLVDLLLAYGADPNLKNNEGKTPLFEAITSGRVDIVTALLDGGANPNLPGPKHMLWPSTYQPACLQLLLARGADFTKTSGIMELAASINKIDSVRILLAAGVDPNAKKDGTYTPLCTSIRDNRPDIMELLLSSGADPNVMASEYPAWKCVTHKRVQFLPRLVAAGADLHRPPGILEMAVQMDNMEALTWLLDQGVSPNDRNDKGHTPLTTAIRERRAAMVDLLLARGANASQRGENWPVCMAVKCPSLLAKILPYVDDPRAHKGVVEMAVMADQLGSIKLLLEAGVSVEDKNGGVFSPLTTALREDRREIVRFLLGEGGADPNSPGEHLPIVKATRRFQGEDLSMIELLLEKGADPNKTYRGWNAIMQAVENGNARQLKLLIEKGGGVDLDAKDDAGRTVAEVAAHTGWDGAREILLAGGNAR
jgi:ankyrin repeat protein